MTLKVHDCFHFNDELDLLDTRLRLLSPVVDEFVIIESRHTFTGQAKPLVFADNRERYATYAHKIVHIEADLSLPTTSAWDREDAQRRAMGSFIARHDDDHLFMVGDVDEFPLPATVEALRAGCTVPVRIGMRHSLYYANWELPTEFEFGTMVFRPSQLDHLMVRAILGDRHDEWATYVEDYVVDAGRHLSFLGGPAAIRKKLAAYSHQEYNNARFRGPRHLEEVVKRGIQLDGVWALRRLRSSEFDSVIAAIARDHPELINHDRAPRRVWRDAYRLMTRLRTSDRGGFITRSTDGRPWLVDVFSPLLAPVQWAVDHRRARHPMPPRTKQRRISVSELAATRSTPS